MSYGNYTPGSGNNYPQDPVPGQYGGYQQAPDHQQPQQYAGAYGYGYAMGPQRPPVGLVQAVKQFFANYANFYGRANRGEYWWSYLALVIVAILLYIPLIASAGASASSSSAPGGAFVFFGILYFIFALAIIVPTIAVTVRRLHDTGRSGWWYLISAVPFGSIVLLVFLVGESRPEGVRFDNPDGSQPKIAA